MLIKCRLIEHQQWLEIESIAQAGFLVTRELREHEERLRLQEQVRNILLNISFGYISFIIVMCF